MRRATLERRLVKPLLFAVLLLPAAGLVLDALGGRLGANPIETLTFATGLWGLRFLLLALAVTPLRNLTGWSLPVRMRRMIALFGFFYVCLHLLVYVVLDQFFAWHDIVADVVKRPYITVGFLGFVLLVPLAVTSTNAMIRRLGGRRWKTLHRLAYIATAAGVLHFLWLVKADHREPLIYAGMWLGLLALRVPVRWVRRALQPATKG